MNQKRRGFTLIELLAVIVILAIIALIAVPVIMNIINKANKSAFKDTAYGVISAGELYYAEQLLEPNGMMSDVTITLPDATKKLQIKGEVPTGSILITKEGKVAIAVQNGKYCVTKGTEDKDVTITENYDSCELQGNTNIEILENFEDNTWASIASACQNNEVPESWNVGDTKETIINGKTVNIMIIGKNHDDYADGSGKAPLTFQTLELVERKAMHSSDTNTSGWDGSDIYSYLNDTLINNLENGIKNNIKPVTKKTVAGGQLGTIKSSSDKLFLLSVIEVINMVDDIYVVPADPLFLEEGVQYEYYRTADLNINDANSNAGKFEVGVIPDDSNDEKQTPWLLRSPYSDSSYGFYVINRGGALNPWKNPFPPSAAIGVSFAFCF